MGAKQFGFGDDEQSTAKKLTRRERFLSEMEAVVPWKVLVDLIKPHYPRSSKKGGRPPYPLTTMLRIHLFQQWYHGMKVHVGVDSENGLIHSVETMAAHVHDLTPAAELLHGEEMQGRGVGFRVAMAQTSAGPYRIPPRVGLMT